MQLQTSDSPAGAFLAARRPEILAPAGDWECLRAAVENGADAVYFGLDRFNARMRAHNFELDDLPEVVAYLHERGVRGYVTFNTLVFSNEVEQAEEYLRRVMEAGVDACIVQDVGVCRLIRALSPDFPIHASTQMTVTSAAGARFAEELGCELVVLARECTLSDIARVRQALGGRALSLEVFVHGALCVAYSGQCLTSEALGGRSANRGECAQACRLPYELIVDGARKDLGDRHYLLSPQDLAGLDVLPELVRAGVSSLKIEGRLKSPEYVANVTSIYRRALDRLLSAGETGERPIADAAARYDLEMAFSRGLYTGWFRGIDNQRLVHGRYPKKRGVMIGRVLSVKDGGVSVSLSSAVKPGDGVVFDRGRPDEPEEGGRIYSVAGAEESAVLRFGRGDVDLSRVARGDLVWKTSDPELDRRLRKTFEGRDPKFKRPLRAVVEGRPGVPLRVTFVDEHGRGVSAESESPLMPATGRGLSEETLRDKLGRLGGTAFELTELEAGLEGALHVPVGDLNRIRRELLERLTSLRRDSIRWTVGAGGSGRSESHAACREDRHVEIAVLVRSFEQLDGALEHGVETIYCELEEVKRYRDAVRLVREAESRDGRRRSVWLAPPRVFKPGEEWILKLVRAAKPDGYLVRNYDHLEIFAGSPCRGDFSLNVANHLTAAHFFERYTLESLTASYDLNIEQLEALAARADAGRLEITLHHNMPMFHMEHCVFCAFLSDGSDYTNCGRPCDRHDLRIRDRRAGREHYVRADTGCRNTVFNGQAQSGAEYLSRLARAGYRRFRIEMMREGAEETKRAIGLYERLLSGEIEAGQVWRELAASSALGVTSGQLSGPAEHARRVRPKSLAILSKR